MYGNVIGGQIDLELPLVIFVHPCASLFIRTVMDVSGHGCQWLSSTCHWSYQIAAVYVPV